MQSKQSPLLPVEELRETVGIGIGPLIFEDLKDDPF